MSKRSMAEVVAEYNKLTGHSVKRFATIEIGERRIAEIGKKPVEPETKRRATKASAKKQVVGDKKWTLFKVSVNGVEYRSIKTAFDELKLPLNKHGKLRLRLKASGKEVLEHNGKKYYFAKA